MEDVNNGETGCEVYGKPLYDLLNFSIKLKVLKQKSKRKYICILIDMKEI